ncbi:MAG: Holliday junction branch migration protein RuvA [Chloroflexi bacterium]|nr:Holliday junction branch migration protein RuvA [Chloroflexota bacterium]
MIALLQGNIQSTGLDWAVITVNGVGFKASMPTHNLNNMHIGQEVTVYTHLYVREDVLALFAFLDEDELNFFKLLITVSGLGPKLALALLSQKNLTSLKLAIAAGDTKSLSTISGIGKKTAERLCLELKDKVGGLALSVNTGHTNLQDEVMDALISLGYSTSEAAQAISNLTLEQRQKDIEEQISAVLKYMGNA